MYNTKSKKKKTHSKTNSSNPTKISSTQQLRRGHLLNMLLVKRSWPVISMTVIDRWLYSNIVQSGYHGDRGTLETSTFKLVTAYIYLYPIRGHDITRTF